MPEESTSPCESENEQKLAEEKNRYIRLLADFSNYKKRTEAEREEIIKFSNEVFLVGLLPIIDNFDRAIAASHGSKDELLKGIALVKKQLEDTLGKMGVSVIESIGKQFDPNLHEAILKKESNTHPKSTILEEMQKGYTFHGKVIRPAMVVVSTKNKEE